MNNVLISNKNYRMMLLFLISIATYLILLQLFSFKEVADDGAFFMRYAENMANGEFWVWNIGEEPIWGASAPIYTLLVALPIYFGISPEVSIFGIGIFLSGLSFAAMVAYFTNRFGFAVGVVLLIFIISDPDILYFSYIGLETPLVYFLIGVGVWGLIGRKSWLFIGVISGVLMIHKLDMIPAAGFLLIAFALQDRHSFYKALIVSCAIATIWYGFAWLYFGAPVPNSFLTKSLFQDEMHKIIDWTWFSSLVLFKGMHPILLILSFFAFIDKKFRTVALFLGGIITTHVFAYSIWYPFEPYNWYAMPSVFSLAILAAIGVHVLIQQYTSKSWNLKLKNYILISGMAIFIIVSQAVFLSTVRGINDFANAMYDWAEAGRWVDKNTPLSFKVYTMWGNPAYFSNRYVIDGSFLNRKYERNDLINSTNPEVLILGLNPGSTLENPVFEVLLVANNNNYKVVKGFEKFWKPGFAVLVRKDVIHLLK